jgi:hypothetical protein
MPFIARWNPRPQPSRATAGDATAIAITAAPTAIRAFMTLSPSLAAKATRPRNDPFHEIPFINRDPKRLADTLTRGH